MAGGYRSPLSPLGISAPIVVIQGGYRSHLFRWGGGACSKPAVVQGGYRSLLAFWTGGAFAGSFVPPAPVDPGGIGRSRQKPKSRDFTMQINQEDEIIAVWLNQLIAEL